MLPVPLRKVHVSMYQVPCGHFAAYCTASLDPLQDFSLLVLTLVLEPEYVNAQNPSLLEVSNTRCIEVQRKKDSYNVVKLVVETMVDTKQNIAGPFLWLATNPG